MQNECVLMILKPFKSNSPSSRRNQVNMEAELISIFVKADKDGNGTLSREEIRKLVETTSNCKITDKEVETAFQQLDLDSDGKVSCQGNSNHFLYQRIPDNKKS